MPPYESEIDHYPGTTCLLFTTSVWVLQHPTDLIINILIITCPRASETGPIVYHPYPRRLESLTVCRCYYKGSTSPQLFKDPECWSGRDLNLRPPTQQAGANPIELTGQRYLDVQLKLCYTFMSSLSLSQHFYSLMH